MNIYKFVYFYFYCIGDDDLDHHVMGLAGIMLAVVFHFGFLQQLILLLYHYKFMWLPNLGTYGRNKDLVFLCTIMVMIICSLFLNRNKGLEIVRRYENISKTKATILTSIIIFLPFTLGMLLSSYSRSHG